MATPAGQREPDLGEKVRFLSEGAALGEPGVVVERVETHFAWVFLTPSHAYKLRKPIRYHGVDTLSLDSRQARCHEELQANQSLAPGVYLGVIPLTRTSGGLRLDVPGEIVDWLLRMRRLPAERMFDTLLRHGSWRPEDLEALELRLREFYAAAATVQLAGPAYCARLHAAVAYNHRELLAAKACGVEVEPVIEVASLQNRLLDELRPVLSRRADDGWIRDCHGDLRPEHICVGPPVRIIDRLEFDVELRALDPIEDLCFLRLECEREHAHSAGAWLLRQYLAESGTEVPPALVDFYISNRAMTRARLAAWRVSEPDADAPGLLARVRDYMNRALVAAQRASRACHSSSSRLESEP
jgi:aminoglycoside phosphotransferase family enzyme